MTRLRAGLHRLLTEIETGEVTLGAVVWRSERFDQATRDPFRVETATIVDN